MSDQASEAQMSGGPQGNSAPTDAGTKTSNQGSSSKGSTQQSSAKNPLQNLSQPALKGLEIGLGKDSQGPTRVSTPEPPVFIAKEAETAQLAQSRSPSQAQKVHSSGSQGMAALEQAGKSMGKARGLRYGESERRQEERERARRGFSAVTLRRFRAKLEGFTERGAGSMEGGQRTVLSVEEQVEKLLQQATSRENLAQMYEGWTPWI